MAGRTRTVAQMTKGERGVRDWLEQSPFNRATGIRLERLGTDEAELRVGSSDNNLTSEATVHAGALATLVVAAATAAVWSRPSAKCAGNGAVVSMSLDFLAPAIGDDVVALGTVARRGGSLCFCDVELCTARGDRIANALVIYKTAKKRIGCE
jgi:uncharacterized protein (TIGR00369 family)